MFRNSEPKKKRSTMYKVLRFLKQLFAQHSHLAKYLPLMTETKENRICRLVNDQSFNLVSGEV